MVLLPDPEGTEKQHPRLATTMAVACMVTAGT
jgi:hypothetical protein